MVYFIGVVEPLPMATPFTDGCYSPELVAHSQCCPRFRQGFVPDVGRFPPRTSLNMKTALAFDTAPREFVLCLMEERNVPELR